MIGPTVLSIANYGAAANGVNIENRAFESAFAHLPADGGTVLVPPGTYRIDAVRSIRPLNNTRLVMTGVRLMVVPNDQPRYNAILIEGLEDVEIVGGEIIGDRMLHTYTAGSTHEWGHGVKVTGAKNIRLIGVTSTLCAGDGFSINGENLTLTNCKGLQCRRQGLTIGGSNGVLIDGGAFEGTGNLGTNLGTKPMAGIDIEPDPPRAAKNIIIRGTRVANNGGSGILLYEGVGGVVLPATVEDVTVEDATIENNVYGIESIRASGLVLQRNTVKGNSYSGIKLAAGTSAAAVKDSIFIGNSDRGGTAPTRPLVTLTGKPPTDRDILITSTEPGIVIGTNTYS